MNNPPDHVQEETVLLVEWALTPIGHFSPKEARANAIVSATLSVASEAHKELL